MIKQVQISREGIIKITEVDATGAAKGTPRWGKLNSHNDRVIGFKNIKAPTEFKSEVEFNTDSNNLTSNSNGTGAFIGKVPQTQMKAIVPLIPVINLSSPTPKPPASKFATVGGSGDPAASTSSVVPSSPVAPATSSTGAASPAVGVGTAATTSPVVIPVPSSASPPVSSTLSLTPSSAASSPSPAPALSSTSGAAGVLAPTANGSGATPKVTSPVSVPSSTADTTDTGAAGSHGAMLKSMGTSTAASSTTLGDSAAGTDAGGSSTSTNSSDARSAPSSSRVFPDRYQGYENVIGELPDNEYLVCLIFRRELNKFTMRFINNKKVQSEIPIGISADNSSFIKAGEDIAKAPPYTGFGGDNVLVASFATLSSDQLRSLTVDNFKQAVINLHQGVPAAYTDRQLSQLGSTIEELIKRKQPVSAPPPVLTTPPAATSLPVNSTPAVSFAAPGGIPVASPAIPPTTVVPPPASTTSTASEPAPAIPSSPRSATLQPFTGNEGVVFNSVKDTVRFLIQTLPQVKTGGLEKADEDSMAEGMKHSLSDDRTILTLGIPTKIEKEGFFASRKATAWAQIKVTSQSVSLDDGSQFNTVVFAAMVAAACENLYKKGIYPLQLDLDLRKLGITDNAQVRNLDQTVMAIITNVSAELKVPDANGLRRDVGIKINYFQSEAPAPTPTATSRTTPPRPRTTTPPAGGPGAASSTPPTTAVPGGPAVSSTTPTSSAAPTPTAPTGLTTTAPVSVPRPISSSTPPTSTGTSPLGSASPSGSSPSAGASATDPLLTQRKSTDPAARTITSIESDSDEEADADASSTASSRPLGRSAKK